MKRVIAWLIDWLPVFVLSGIGALLLALMPNVETVCVVDDAGDFCPTINAGPSVTAWAIFVVLEAISLAYIVWNKGYRQGTTGSSVGKRIMKFGVVGKTTGQPIGFGPSVVRELIYLVAYGACGVPWVIAVLFPLWDAKRQTLVDKLVKTVCRPR